MGKRSRYHLIGAGLIITISLFSLMLGMTQKQGRMLKSQLHEHTNALFDLIVITRRWNAQHMGVFVTKGPGIASNPYLTNPDVVDNTGTVYTRKNPALMTREISELAKSEKRISFHITSLKLLNSGNAPDDWERSALESFLQGENERVGEVNRNGRVFFRLMRPLYVEQSCLVCHGKQGYAEGEIRGGISVEVPFDSTLKAIQENSMNMVFLFVGLMCLFAVTFYFFIWKVMGKLEQQKTQLEELNKTKNKFLGMCAHDLRNPLHSIMGYSGLLASNADVLKNEKLSRFTGLIKKSSNKMLSIVTSFLDISVIESGNLELRLHKGSLKVLLEEDMETYQFLADRKGITIQASLDETADVNFDHHRISQVFDNIIGNAIKYSPQGSTIKIVLVEANKHIIVRIQDEGPGIPEKNRAKLFQEYRRFKTESIDEENSAGLGLAITKKIVDFHNGNIEIESQAGKGSTFILIFPVAT